MAVNINNIPQGWECPRCHRINAPHVGRCDCEAAPPCPERCPRCGKPQWPCGCGVTPPASGVPWQPPMQYPPRGTAVPPWWNETVYTSATDSAANGRIWVIQ